MQVTVNGEPREVPAMTTVATLVESMRAPDRGTAVAVDGSVVPRTEWTIRMLAEGSRVELVRAVQGG